MNLTWLGARLGGNLYIIHARSMHLTGYVVGIPFLVFAAADAVERMEYFTLASAKKRVNERLLSEANAGRRLQLLLSIPRPCTPSTQPSPHPSIIFIVRAFASTSTNRHSLAGMCSTMCPSFFQIPLLSVFRGWLPLGHREKLG